MFIRYSQYNYLGQVTRVMDALNQASGFTYDELGRLIRKTDALGAVSSFAYDPNGNLVRSTDPAGNSVTYQYDGLNRLVQQIDALNQQTVFHYDPKGNLTQLVNPKNDTYSFEYDAADRLVREVNFLGEDQSYGLDANGNVTLKTDFNGQTMVNHFDALNRLTGVEYPGGGEKQFVYDAVGNLTQAVNENATEKYYYNALSWLTKAETLNFRGVTGETKTVDFTYDKVGNPTAMTTSFCTGPLRQVSYQYDNLNRLVKATLPDQGITEFKYDALNRVIERINANDTSTVYGYTARNQIESIINYNNRSHSQVLSSYGYLYNANGERTFQLEGNGDLTAYQYDPAGRLSKVYYPLQDNKKKEDLKERVDYGLADMSVLDTGSMVNQTSVSYLNLNSSDQQLLNGLYSKIQQTGGSFTPWRGFWQESFSYDVNGNITVKQNGWGDINYQYNAANQLTRAGNRSYQYDLNGNLIREVLGSKQADYQYNYDNRLTQVMNPYQGFLNDESNFAGEIKYAYDALGRKIRKERQGTGSAKIDKDYYIYDGLGLDVIAEYQAAVMENNPVPGGKLEQVNEYYYGNGMLLGMKQIDHPDKSYWVEKGPMDGVSVMHQDALGSVTMITGANAQVIERYSYDAFGEAYEGIFANEIPGAGRPKSYKNGNVVGFTGQRFEAEVGVYGFAYRDYDPVVKRWMTVDPIKDGLNWYQYCSSDPVNFIDPLGLDLATAVKEGGKILGTTWGVGLAEPTIVGEIIATVVTVGVGGWIIYEGVKELLTAKDDTTVDDNTGDTTSDEPKIVDKQPNPRNGPSNTTTRTVDENGNPIQDRKFGPDGKATEDIDYTNHGNPKNHPNVPHKHKWDWNNPTDPRGPQQPICSNK
jgi:RHS repeat-associated protein